MAPGGQVQLRPPPTWQSAGRSRGRRRTANPARSALVCLARTIQAAMSRPARAPSPLSPSATPTAPLPQAHATSASQQDQSANLLFLAFPAGNLRPAIAQPDGAVEHGAAGCRVRIHGEIALPFELHW